MSFALPLSHLPRGTFASSAESYGLSSSTPHTGPFLRKIAETEKGKLTASLASEWLKELDANIEDTKRNIQKRIADDLPSFQRQLDSSIDVQTRIRDLSAQIDSINHVMHDPNEGILPTLNAKLAAHSAISQEYSDSKILLDSLAHLSRCTKDLNMLVAQVDQGQLPNAVKTSEALRKSLDSSPEPLGSSLIFRDIEKRFRAVGDSIQEQLGNAYRQSIQIISDFPTTKRLIIRPAVQVQTRHSLADPNPSAQTPLHTLSLSDVLASHSEEYLSRNLTSLRKEIFTSLIDPVLTSKHTAVHIDSQNESISFDLSNSSSSQSHPFDSLRTLVSFLSQNLIAVLPTTLGSQFSSQLFQYLSTSILTLLLKPSIPNSQDSLPSFLSLATEAVNFESELAELGARTKDVTEWAVSLPTHYERKRRQDILETARRLVESRVEADKEGVRIELEESVPEPTTAEGKKPEASPFVSGSSLPDSDNAFASAGEDAWGFEEEVEPEPPTKEVKAETDPEPEADGWGWDESAPNDNNPAEDDPWDDPDNPPVKVVIDPPREPRDSLLVDKLAKRISELAEQVMQEAEALLKSQVFSTFKLASSSTSAPGSLLLSTASSPFDLFRAIYPVAHSGSLKSSIPLRLRFSNDSKYLAKEARRLMQVGEKNCPSDVWKGGKEKLVETVERLNALGEVSFEEAVDRQESVLLKALSATQGFHDVGDDSRYAICENSMQEVYTAITSFAMMSKTILVPTDYTHATGMLIESVIHQIVQDILAIPDIPEVESHRLNALCTALRPLEELFASEPGANSSIALHVPSWLKFCYLAELLEASLADISYLFDEGALVDFDTDELILLIRALFADTPQRAKAFDKISSGHPSQHI